MACVSCKDVKDQPIDYCQMLEHDQSYTSTGTEDSLVRESNRQKRIQLFEANYETILREIESNHFPDLSIKTTTQDSCRFWAITMTFIHMAQTRPEVLFSEKSRKMMAQEILEGHLQPEDIVPAFRVTFGHKEFCSDLRESIEQAILAWKVGDMINAEPTYVACN